MGVPRILPTGALQAIQAHDYDGFVAPTAKAAPRPPTSTPSSSDAVAASIAELGSKIDTLAATVQAGRQKRRRIAKVPAEKVQPDFAIADDAKSWVPAESGARHVQRHAWPLLSRTDLDFGDFHNYLIATKGLKESSADQHIQKLQYFFGLFSFAEEPVSHIGFVASLYKTGILSELLALPILDPGKGTTRNVLAALEHFANHLQLICGRRNLRESARVIGQLRVEILEPFKKRISKARVAARAKKNAIDAELLSKVPAVDVLQEGVKQSMHDLNTLWLKYRKATTVPWNVRFAVNVALAGITFYNTYGGRPGEWSSMLRQKVLELIDGGGDFLVIDDHKTVEKYGPLGRWMPDGNVQAMRRAVNLHLPESQLLFASHTAAPNKKLMMSTLLKKWSSVYTPGYPAFLPTLIRKWYSTATQYEEDKKKVFKLLCDMDGHTTKVGKENYLIPNPEQHARTARSAFEFVVGEPVQWPSEANLAAAVHCSDARLAKHFYVGTGECQQDTAQAEKSDSETESSGSDSSSDDSDGSGDSSDEEDTPKSPTVKIELNDEEVGWGDDVFIDVDTGDIVIGI